MTITPPKTPADTLDMVLAVVATLQKLTPGVETDAFYDAFHAEAMRRGVDPWALIDVAYLVEASAEVISESAK